MMRLGERADPAQMRDAAGDPDVRPMDSGNLPPRNSVLDDPEIWKTYGWAPPPRLRCRTLSRIHRTSLGHDGSAPAYRHLAIPAKPAYRESGVGRHGR